jgi:hypothetical protein
VLGIIVIALAVAVGSRSGGQKTAVTQVVTAEATATLSPTVTPVPTVPPSLYEDDFDDPNSGWDVYHENMTQAGYEDGAYRVAVYRDAYFAWGNPDHVRDLADFEVEVDARLVEGPVNNSMGLLVRYAWGTKNFYWFQVSSDGFYSVDRLDAGEFTGLLGWEPSEAINQGVGATNHLRVVCRGSQFSFYVNGVHLGDVTDATYASGGLGLGAGTFEEPDVVVHFDNFQVRAPQE